jgi:alcohol dehydrogenase class IV
MITLHYPGKLVFGEGSIGQFIDDYLQSGLKRLFVVTIPPVAARLSAHMGQLQTTGVVIRLNDTISGEPTFDDFEKILAEARAFEADSVVGAGGGSVLDVAKLVAAQLLSPESTQSITGNGKIRKRDTYLACIPTTSGTGSEMSPNAIFLNEKGDKIGVISPFLVPDGSYVDPALTVSVPPFITAATGIDALSHCLEAYTNKNAHPVIDLIALEGIRLIAKFLERAYKDGNDKEARKQIALGSMYGGICLGPVNTAGVHALAYPLGADYHLAHGLSIALLLPAVMEFNLPAAPERHAAIAIALGAQHQSSAIDTGKLGIDLLRQLISSCGIPGSLEEAGVKYENIENMAIDAMKVQRLLKNNVREITQQDAVAIYKAAFQKK